MSLRGRKVNINEWMGSVGKSERQTKPKDSHHCIRSETVMFPHNDPVRLSDGAETRQHSGHKNYVDMNAQIIKNQKTVKIHDILGVSIRCEK